MATRFLRARLTAAALCWAGLVDVTAGNNSAAFIQNNVLVHVKGFWAGPGYDLASGVGTVNADLFVPELVQAASVG